MRARVFLPAVAALAWASAAATATASLPEVVSTRAVTYCRVGPLAVQADVFVPPGSGPFPVVLWIHGGSLIFGDRGMLPADERERYLRAGLGVVALDYRLAPETKLDGILEDLDTAHAWLRREGPALGLDPARLGVVGHSAGGYLALMSGVRFRLRPRLGGHWHLSTPK